MSRFQTQSWVRTLHLPFTLGGAWAGDVTSLSLSFFFMELL